MDAPTPTVAMLVDISQSRSHADRRELQTQIETAFARVNTLVTADQPLQATVGDEFQAAYGDLDTALRAALLARLSLPEGVDCRFGLGRGQVAAIGTGVAGVLQDGSAWWVARKAIDEARRHQYSKLGFVRTWYRSAEPDATEALVNAYLLGRDHIVSAMNPRARRLLLGQLLGETQGALAQQEGITQSAVSQNLARSGANAVIAGDALLFETTGVAG